LRLEIDLHVERSLGDPLIKIVVDDYLTLYDGIAHNYYDFDVDLTDGGHDLTLVHYGKRPEHHVLDNQGNITIDRHIEIKNIKLDNITLESELWTGKFFPVYMHKADHEPYFICPNLYLGHNGAWKLEFATPAAAWLIDIRKPGPKLSGTIFKTNSETLEQAKNFFRDLPDV
jgi:hypothetical protein